MKTIDKLTSYRLNSLDALRGFNMFWIIGAERIVHVLNQMNLPGTRLLAVQLRHTRWNGFTFYDLIFPMFIFLVGVSATFSVRRSRELGKTNRVIRQRIFSRTIKLFLLGLLVNNLGLSPDQWVENIRWMGVLQRIALCYCGTALLQLYVKPRYQAVWAGGLLVGYWLLISRVAVPGHEVAVLNYPGANITNYIDNLLLPGRLYYQTWDPEGLLSTIPAIATCLLGSLTGYWLNGKSKNKEKTVVNAKKLIVLMIAGLLMLALGIFWGMFFPINKKIWTSSFVLLTAGLSAVMMGLFYWLIDIRGQQKWAFPFIIIGRNAIFSYLLANLVPFRAITAWLVERRFMANFGLGRYLLAGIFILLSEWLIIYFMYRRKLFLKL
jgi:predicted acyltransferase